MAFKDYLRLLRPQQWYKNLVIFLALIFSSNVLVPEKLYLVILGFVSLCLVSSANYAFNDIIDRKRDRMHPEKRLRPLAAGKIKVLQAFIVAFLLLLLGLILAYRLDMQFLYAAAFLFVFSQIYSLWLKKEAFIDILAIAVNFVVRAVAGAYVISVYISPWLILCVGLLSLFLSSAKRKADLSLLGRKACSHKSVLRFYTPEITNALLIISTTLLIIAYALFSFLSIHQNLLLTLPFALYVIFRYLQLTYTDSIIARHPEKSITDLRLVLGIMIWVISAIVIISF